MLNYPPLARDNVTRKCTSPLCSKLALADSVEDPREASPLCSKIALADSVEDPLEILPLCSKVALADSVGDPLEALPFCSKVALTDSVEDPLETSPLFSKRGVGGDEGERLQETIHCRSLKSTCKKHLEHYSAMTNLTFKMQTPVAKINRTLFSIFETVETVVEPNYALQC